MARTNVGLCYGMLGDHLAAARHHQEALRIAIQLQSFSGQSISVGNLGALTKLTTPSRIIVCVRRLSSEPKFFSSGWLRR